MGAAEMIRTMVSYNYAYQHRLWDSIMTLTDEQFTADIPYSHGSLHNHMMHLASTDTAYLRGLNGDPNARGFRFNPADYPTRASVRALCEQVAADVNAYVATLDDEAVEQKPLGVLSVWQVLLHVVNHGTDHRVQVLRALHDFGAPTFDQDLLFYFLGR